MFSLVTVDVIGPLKGQKNDLIVISIQVAEGKNKFRIRVPADYWMGPFWVVHCRLCGYKIKVRNKKKVKLVLSRN